MRAHIFKSAAVAGILICSAAGSRADSVQVGNVAEAAGRVLGVVVHVEAVSERCEAIGPERAEWIAASRTAWIAAADPAISDAWLAIFKISAENGQDARDTESAVSAHLRKAKSISYSWAKKNLTTSSTCLMYLRTAFRKPLESYVSSALSVVRSILGQN